VYDTRSRRARPLVQPPFDEEYPTISPDGRWIAYVSDESGRAEVYVQAFPQLGAKRQISTDGGIAPVWDRQGRELYYQNRGKMMAVTITTGPSLVAATSRVLFAADAYEPGYDVAPEGRFIMIEDGPSETPATELAIVLNWTEELKQRVPTR
jgi:Tol biopolymer transport system component